MRSSEGPSGGRGGGPYRWCCRRPGTVGVAGALSFAHSGPSSVFPVFAFVRVRERGCRP
jgi:hypothetical protein